MLKMIITGNVGKNAEVRTLQDGSQVISFSVGVRSGKDQTQWVSCAKFVKQGGSVQVAQYLTKGAKVLCEGMPSASSYVANDGTTKVDLKLRVYELELLGGATEQAAPSGDTWQATTSTGVEIASPAAIPSAPITDLPF